MIRTDELLDIPVFACLTAAQRERTLEAAAEIHLHAQEWLVREGEQAQFFVVLSGTLEIYKNVNGREIVAGELQRPGFFGEVPMLLGAPIFASVRAKTFARLARLDHREFRELLDASSEFSAIVVKTMANRVNYIQESLREIPATRVLLVGSQYDTDCRDIRTFLSMNRIPYEWIDRDKQPDRVPVCIAGSGVHGPSVVVDGTDCLGEQPTVRGVAERLGFRTAASDQSYDVVVVGGGPAGLAAAVYGASEGLKTVMIERGAAGGQAGTSSRIENYLGFPGGVSGNELADRAVRQAAKFGAEMVVTRDVTSIQPIESGYCVELDGGERLSARTVVLATGVDWRRLEAEGVDRLQGRGVLYGAARTEASNVVGEDIFIVGGGNSAGQAAMFFAGYARSVTMLVRGEGLTLSMSQYLVDQIEGRCNIHIEPFTEVLAVEGEDHLERIVTISKNESPRTRSAEALFIMIGADASTEWLPRGLQRDTRGYVCTGRDVSDLPDWKGTRTPFLLETSLPGFFCAGDVRHDSVKRVASSVGEGSMAIAFVHQYLALEQGTRASLLAAD